MVRRPPLLALLLLALLLLLPAAAAQPVALEGDLAPSYRPGEEAWVTFRISAQDAAALPDASVLFLNVVLPDPARNYPQVAHRLFASAALEGENMFQAVLDADALREGRSTVLHFRLKDGAPAGDYHVVLQLFDGSTTSPHRVRLEDRIAVRAFPFRIEPAIEGDTAQR